MWKCNACEEIIEDDAQDFCHNCGYSKDTQGESLKTAQADFTQEKILDLEIKYAENPDNYYIDYSEFTRNYFHPFSQLGLKFGIIIYSMPLFGAFAFIHGISKNGYDISDRLKYVIGGSIVMFASGLLINKYTKEYKICLKDRPTV